MICSRVSVFIFISLQRTTRTLTNWAKNFVIDLRIVVLLYPHQPVHHGPFPLDTAWRLGLWSS